jgi:hypothetical protein
MRFTNAKSGTHTAASGEAHAVGTTVAPGVAGAGAGALSTALVDAAAGVLPGSGPSGARDVDEAQPATTSKPGKRRFGARGTTPGYTRAKELALTPHVGS